MTDRPIIFSSAMVRALLGGTKTQTRRIMKPQPIADTNGRLWWHWSKHSGSCNIEPGAVGNEWFNHCPFGKPGDRLWVRENWRQPNEMVDGSPWFRADYCSPLGGEPGDARKEYRWRPSIHMPRRVSRLTLEVTDIRAQRLQDISEIDARAEGCRVPDDVTDDEAASFGMTPRGMFGALWDGIHGPASWDANPWVWALTFTVRHGNIDALPAQLGD